jgi:hypothetical protein
LKSVETRTSRVRVGSDDATTRRPLLWAGRAVD